MKTILLIRHAKSSWDDASMKDFDRPLNARGTRDAEEMSKRLKKKIQKIDAFISSPALRAKTTAKKFADSFGGDVNHIVFIEGLYLAPSSFFSQVIAGIDNTIETAAIFSHNPGITEFANTLTTAIRTDNIPTSGIFAVSAAIESWHEFASAEKKFLFFDYPKLHS